MLLLLPFILISCQSTGSSTSDDDPQYLLAELPELVHAEVNESRARHNHSPLALSSDLAAEAESHSEDMAKNEFFSHTSPERGDLRTRLQDAEIDCGEKADVRPAENLFRATAFSAREIQTDQNGISSTYKWKESSRLAREVVVGWKDSPAHRSNLFSPTAVRHGIGVALSQDAEHVYVTQILC